MEQLPEAGKCSVVIDIAPAAERKSGERRLTGMELREADCHNGELAPRNKRSCARPQRSEAGAVRC